MIKTMQNVKSQKDIQMKRRAFLKSSLAMAAGSAALNPSALSLAEPSISIPQNGKIPVREFGNTGVSLPILGMGGSAMVNIWAASYGVKLDPVEKRSAMVRYAFDQGIRYFDTARVYQESESIVGKGLKGVREQAFVATKIAVQFPKMCAVALKPHSNS